ncbi:MAG: hypothetical protein KF788_14105 [Piscinibacter sp.]|nr:hypothetical protein [Piscinibacter sp.]
MKRPTVDPRRWLPLLLAAMLLAQGLGLVHRVLHAPRSGVPGVHASEAVGTGAPQARAAGDAFGHDEGDPQCRLFDQLAQGDLAFGVVAVAVAAPAPSTPPGAPPTGRLAPQASGFLARGPPLLTA